MNLFFSDKIQDFLKNSDILSTLLFSHTEELEETRRPKRDSSLHYDYLCHFKASWHRPLRGNLLLISY